MASIPSGIHGAISGRVGRVVGCIRGGKAYLRTRPAHRTKTVTPKESANRNRFKIAHAWLRPLLPLVRVGFHVDNDGGRAFLRALSHLLNNAIVGDGHTLTIEPSLVKISTGELPNAQNITIARTSEEEVQVTWDTTTNTLVRANDQVIVALYDIENKRVQYQLAASLRRDGIEEIPVEAGRTYHAWIAFCSADRSMKSDSIYLNTI